MLRRLIRPTRRILPLWAVFLVATPFLLEALVHRRAYDVPVPPAEDDGELDRPFYTACREPDVGAPRENAAFVMLTRNSELEQANHTMASVERHFNRWFHYPVVFLNDQPWDPHFIQVLNATASGGATFEVVPPEQWTYPPHVDSAAARAAIREQGQRGISYGGLEGYHHMCRFYSGNFYKLDVLQKYRWYWRLEPDVDFLCSITYDPFVEMARRNRVYGFTISLWEEPDTCPSLFRAVADYKALRGLPGSGLWKAMMQASWAPWPLRRLMGAWLAHRDRLGDSWSRCHYWSNFEIADFDFFRSREYQDFFEYLDRTGGFYYERWGDAAVHSLAVGMLVDPRRVHHFEDFGYRHDALYQCPANAPGGQLPESAALRDAGIAIDGEGGEKSVAWAEELEGGIGCRCECDGRRTRNHHGYCLNKLKQPTSTARPWLTWFL